MIPEAGWNGKDGAVSRERASHVEGEARAKMQGQKGGSGTQNNPRAVALCSGLMGRWEDG